ncbi:hypothetical protein ACQEVI_10955 [Promicromonospora sp. CA-289599]|uniref:hypothetical protein n=1 Tax=Promicromonospora sp. CA-289599 TaxID=3240014 RepID=UPI003D946198
MRAFASLAVMILVALTFTPVAAAIPVETTRSAPVVMDPCAGSGMQTGARGISLVAEDCGGTETTPAGSGSSGGGKTEIDCPEVNGKVTCQWAGGTWTGRCFAGVVGTEPDPDDPAWKGHDDGVLVLCRTLACAERLDRDDEAHCSGFEERRYWAAVPPGTEVDFEALAQRAVESIGIEPVTIGIVPEDEPGRVGIVGMPVWMWVQEPGPTTYGPGVGEATAGAVTVTASARVVRIVYDMGDGTKVACTGPGTPYEDRYGIAESPDCGHQYDRQGDPYTVTATSYWVADWQGPGDIGGTIRLDRTAETQVVVGEAQVITQ